MIIQTVGQFNLQKHFGGGEVFTQFLCYALEQLGIRTVLFLDPNSDFWDELKLPDSTEIRFIDKNNIRIEDFQGVGWIIGHGPLPESVLRLKGDFLFTAIAHMPVQGRNPEVYRGHDMVFPVSEWVRQGLKPDICPIWQSPLYGISDLSLRERKNLRLKKNSIYDWDERKVRDRILGALETLIKPMILSKGFVKKSGITIGIVSRITPIKQFPILFDIISPIIKQYPNINIEVFGSGGYASVRDLRKAAKPLGDQIRFWGHQDDIQSVYDQLDFILGGLPEKEALGLNLIEAQTMDVPVIAVKSPPFTETVLHGKTGFLFADPRNDNGKDLGSLLGLISSFRAERLRPQRQTDHLAKFTREALVLRLADVLDWANRQTEKTPCRHKEENANEVKIGQSSKILIIRRDNIGDLLCVTPAISALREELPESEIVVLSNSYNAPVLNGNKDIDRVELYVKSKHRGGRSRVSVYLDKLKLFAKLRGENFDYIVVASTFNKRDWRLAKLLNPKRIIGYVGDTIRPRPCDIGMELSKEKLHEVEHVYNLFGAFNVSSVIPHMKIVSGIHSDQNSRYLESHQDRTIVGVHISARKVDQRWAAENFVRLIENLDRKFNASFLIFWSPGSRDNAMHPGDDEKAQEIFDLCQVENISLYPTKQLDNLVTGLSLCDYVICSDGGGMHIAAALEKPIVCMFGNSDARHWYPWGVPYRLLESQSGKVVCISVEAVQSAFEDLYGEPS